jgi:DNA-binding transcriptional MerR regulator
VASLLTISEFSRLTHVSVKALRHYHDVGLLPPAAVDPSTRYRFYAAAQAPTALLIRRFRDLDMPLDQIRAVVESADRDARDRIVLAHLQSMERRLEQVQATVASLRGLLGPEAPRPAIAFRTLISTPALTVTARVEWDETEAWLRDNLTALRNGLEYSGGVRAGADGALYSTEFFEAHVGEVTAFIPLAAAAATDMGDAAELAGGPVAVARHRGSFADLDRTYAELGTFVAERGIGVDAPIRENYAVGIFDTDEDEALVTEVCWPILRDPES